MRKEERSKQRTIDHTAVLVDACANSLMMLALELARRIDGFQLPLIPSGIEADVKMIASTTDCVTENHDFAYPFRMDQIGLRDVISMLVPSECPKEGVRGPAAVDHERINGFSNLLVHVRTQHAVYEIFGETSIDKN